MEKLHGLIPAAGKGVRARPYTTKTPKGMLEINGTPNLERIIAIMRDDLRISDISIVVGHLGQSIKDYFGDGSRLGVRLHYIDNEELDKGLAHSVYLGQRFVDGYFCVMLSDECYIRSNHEDLLSFPFRDFLVTCAGMHVDDQRLIERNYSVYSEGSKVTRLVEKPKHVDNYMMGSGTFVLGPGFFPLLKEAFDRSASGYVEFVTFIDDLCQAGRSVGFFEITGTYVNVNDRDSLELAKYHERSAGFEGHTVDLLIYSEGDEKNVSFTINRYKEVPGIQNIHVVLPEHNSVEETIVDTGVNIIKCPAGCTLYGEKLKYAMGETEGDIVILAEADYSFPNRDIPKLLTYVREADMVIGTRTTRQLIEQGSTMRGLVRLANAFLGKLLELLWWRREGRFTDVGCTLRAIWRPVLNKIQDRLRARGPEFSAEMVIELLNGRRRVIEIPVNYLNRSQSLIRAYQHPMTALRFLVLICGKRLESMFRQRRSPTAPPN